MVAPVTRAKPFARLLDVTVHPLLACNLGCGYCYQNAERASSPVVPRKSGGEWAHRVASLFRDSEHRDIGIVITGGEPLLMGETWYREFFEGTTAALVSLGKEVKYTLQTNASLMPGPELEQLFRRYRVRFSVHYDGLVDGDELKSHDRKRVIENLGAAGFPLTALVVGTPPALDKLPETLDFFHRVGVSQYQLNAVGGEGRGRMDHNPPPRRRAMAEFMAGFHAWKNGFIPYEAGICWKFVEFCRAECADHPRPWSEPSRDCSGGEAFLTIYPDGAVYPCGFFFGLSGPSFFIDELERLDLATVGRLHRACKHVDDPLFAERCPSCEARSFCRGYCAMSVRRGNFGTMCEAQLELHSIMRENPAVATAIANAFLEFKEREHAQAAQDASLGG